MREDPARTAPASAGPDGRAERLSTEALPIPFVGRDTELEAALTHLLPAHDAREGRVLVVHGDSGTGKTFFVREIMRRVSDARPDGLSLYVDVANDEYQSSRTIAALLKLSLVAGPRTGSSMISVPDQLSLERFRRRAGHRGFGRGFLRALAHAVGGAFGLGTAVSAALQDGPGRTAQVEDELATYLAWVAKRAEVFVTIDNVQFLNLDVRLTIESILQRVGTNVRLVAVDRTVGGASELDPPLRCFADNRVDVHLPALSESEIEQIVASAIGEHAESGRRLAEDIFVKTGGLAKDVEFCLRQYALELGRGARVGAIEGLLSTVDRLPLIHRQFLIIAALLDGGVKTAIARGTVRRLAAVDAPRLDHVVDELVSRDYLRLNSETGDRLRPGHERIVIAIRDLAGDDLHEEVRRSLIAELADALEAPDADESETYLLHCLVGLQTAQELTRNIHYISRLIQSQHRQDQFSYLVAIADELHDVLPLLPEHVLDDLLDAMQKSSAFEKGLQVVRLLDAKDVPGTAGRRIHRLKYLTQAYRYDDALALSEELGEDEWAGVYRINALLALDRVAEARAIADTQLTQELSECQAVLRRNTITLFDGDMALRHLDEAYAYFEREQSDFRLATVDTNRSVVYLGMARYGDALRCLERAVDRMQYVSSREVFQAHINLAVRSALLGDHAAAVETLDEAALFVPRALLFDQVKIAMNRAVIACAAGAIGVEECERCLERSLHRIRGVPMPYLQRALVANLAVARGERSMMAARVDDRVSLSLGLPASGGRSGCAWTLMTSVHWRY